MTHLTNFPGLAPFENLDERSDDSKILYDSKTLLFKDCVQKILENNSKKYEDSSNKINIHGNIDKQNKKFNIVQQNEKINKVKKQISVISPKKKKKEKEDKKSSNNFLCKKRNRFLFTINNPKEFSVFNHGGYNHYSKKLIQEVIENNFQNNIENATGGANAESGNKKKRSIKLKNIKKRKENSDNIRKKIKTRFFKVLKNKVNERLKIAGSQKFFKFLPNKFITNVSKEKNKSVLDLTFKEMFSKYLCEGGSKDQYQSELINYYHNLEVLEYLEKNNDISEKSNFNIFKNMKFSQIFNEYLKSKEFEMEIALLKKENESDKYIKDYIIRANDLIEFFSN